MKIALVVMPWWNLESMPLGVATLKPVMNAAGFPADCLYLNLRFYARIGVALASALSSDVPYQEWFFAQHLFGPKGTGERTSGVEEVLGRRRRVGAARELAGFLARTGVPRARLRRLAEKDVPEFLADCRDGVDWSQYGLIGFSSTFASHAAGLALARELKARFPDKPIVFGGANVEGEMGVATLKGCPWIDYVVDGEAEAALPALARNLRDGAPFAEVPGVSYRRGGEVVARAAGRREPADLAGLPDPDHGDFLAQLSALRGAPAPPPMTFEISRGCWWGEKQHCTFCGINGQIMTYRSKSPDAALGTVVRLHRTYRARRLQATDNILGLEHLRELLPKLAAVRREHGLDWSIFFEIKANLTAEQMDLLRAAGVDRLQPGIESLSTPVLRLMRKGIRAIHNVQTLKLAAGRGIRLDWNLISGFPGEDPAEYARMARLVPSLTHLEPPPGLSYLRLHRFSPYHFDWRALGTGEPRPHGVYRLLYPEPRFASGEMAYFFEFAGRRRQPRYPALARAVEFWGRTWQRNFFASVTGLGFVELHDSRPLSLGGGARLRSDFLEGLEARVFRACDSVRTFGQILEACRRDDPGCAEADVRGVLERMEQRRWVLREENLYLNLAVPAAGLGAEQARLFALLSALPHAPVVRRRARRVTRP